MPFAASIFGHSSRKESKDISTDTSDVTVDAPVSSPSTDNKALSNLGNQDKFEYILELTKKAKHTGKPFHRHLFSVYKYLKLQNAPEEVCDAGLFHSIYGTEFYNFQNNRITREIVRGIIGEYAEELVYIFCTSKDRFHVIVDNTQGLSPRQVMDLCHIEFANLLDQNKDDLYDEKLKILNDTITRLQNDG
jgi:hypothetical protein